MKLIMKSTATFIATEATKGSEQHISRIVELNEQVIEETETYYLLRTQPETDETYSI